MLKRILCSLVIIPLASGAMAQGALFDGMQFDLDYTRSKSATNKIDTYTFSGYSDLQFNDRWHLGLSLGHSTQKAFGLDFDATTVGLHPGYEVTPGLTLGGYVTATSTNTPANFKTFYGYGLEAHYFAEPFNATAYYGVLSGSNITSANQNHTMGLRGEIAVNDRFSFYGAYQQDDLNFRNLHVQKTTIGGTYRLSGLGGLTLPAELDFSIGQMKVNTITYDQIGLGVSFPFGPKAGREVREIDPFHSVSLRHSFSF